MKDLMATASVIRAAVTPVVSSRTAQDYVLEAELPLCVPLSKLPAPIISLVCDAMSIRNGGMNGEL